jgi:hypothetical protein
MTTPTATNAPNQRTSRKRPADLTGKLMQQQQADHAVELETRAKELGLANEARSEELKEEIDLTGRQTPDDVEVMPVEVKHRNVSIRVNYPIEDMTFGREIISYGDPENGVPPVIGNLKSYTFEEGRNYLVPHEVAEHLDAKGYLWH